MKKILFVNPSYRDNILENVKVLALPPLNLALLASYTPDRYEVAIVDEFFDTIDFDLNCDLVAITSMTPLAPRAYEIANKFRKKGIPVILGGIHPSMMSEEASNFADSVVIGEAEGIWRSVLEDFEKGALKKTYTGIRQSIESLHKPRKDLLSDRYFIPTVQTSRGCPFNCNFCSVTHFNGGRYRRRAIDDIISEIKQIKQNRFFFVDDNIIGSGKESSEYSLALFDRLKNLKKQWGSQTCLTVAENNKLLQAASRSNAKVFFIGFESIEPESLSLMNKHVNLRANIRNFKDAIARIHDHCIAVIGGFIFGSDNDNKDIFDRTVDFIHETKIDGSQLTVQTPFPGTKLYQQLDGEDRLIFKNYPEDWKKYNGFEVVFQPKKMTVQELEQSYAAAYKSVASIKTAFTRAVRTFLTTKSIFGTAIPFFWNYDCYKAVSKKS